MKEQSLWGQTQYFPCQWDSNSDVQTHEKHMKHMKKIFIMMHKSFLFLTFVSLPVLGGDCCKGPDSHWRWTAVTQLSLLDFTRVQRPWKLQEEYAR